MDTDGAITIIRNQATSDFGRNFPTPPTGVCPRRGAAEQRESERRRAKERGSGESLNTRAPEPELNCLQKGRERRAARAGGQGQHEDRDQRSRVRSDTDRSRAFTQKVDVWETRSERFAP